MVTKSFGESLYVFKYEVKSSAIFLVNVVIKTLPCFAIFFFISFVDLPYDVNMPGGLISLNDRIEVDGKKIETEGTFNMAYVSSISGSLPHILLSFVIPDWDITPTSESTYENESVEDALKRNKLYLEQSKDYATAVAMDAAGIKYEVSNKLNYVAYIDSKARTTLKVGDDILEMNGEKVEDTAFTFRL